ncbi:MAG: sulfatase-like hydrolase/transferase, partial [Anaerolineales bacterium]|nr:sulfatase-like hydrolase/transferase [Anaerolineales bacterium]
LLVYAPDEPHHPFTCPPEFAETFQDFRYPLGSSAFDTLDDKPGHHREWADAQGGFIPDGYFYHPLYFGCNSFIDSQYGRIIDAVHQYAPENTYIILTCDHGEMGGAHRLWGKGPAMYEEITHVPFIIQQPGGSNWGSQNPTPVSQADILPTMLDLAGLEIPPILDGESLVPYLNGKVDLDRDVIIEFNRYEIEHDSWGGFQPVRSIISGKYKLVINLLHSDELYSLNRDPAEVVNLIHHYDFKEIRDDLHNRLIEWMNLKRDPFRGPCWERRTWSTSRKLQWMGHFRPRPADGYSPEVRDYDTGLPTKGIKIEHKN